MASYTTSALRFLSEPRVLKTSDEGQISGKYYVETIAVPSPSFSGAREPDFYYLGKDDLWHLSPRNGVTPGAGYFDSRADAETAFAQQTPHVKKHAAFKLHFSDLKEARERLKAFA